MNAVNMCVCNVDRLIETALSNMCNKQPFETATKNTADFSEAPSCDELSATDVSEQSQMFSASKSTCRHPDDSKSDDRSTKTVVDHFPSVSLSTVDVENSEQRMENVTALMESGMSLDEDVISAAEQCVDAVVFGQHLVIATHINEEGPKFWHLHDGKLDVPLTQHFDAQYKKSLIEQDITFAGRNHAQLFSFNDFLIYVRKRSTSMTPCVIQASANNQLSLVSHVHLPVAYFSLFLPQPGSFSMYIVREGILEERNANMKLLRTIEVPRLTNDIPNLSSSAGKKKLLSYTVAVTEDHRYFVIVCPTVGAKNGRYVDVVDLGNNCYLGRCGLDSELMWKVLLDGVYYLVQPAGTENFGLVSVRSLIDRSQTYDYCCITQSDLQLRSPDGQYGVELSPDHSIHIWKTVSTPSTQPATVEQKVCTAEQKAPTGEQKSPTAEQTARTEEQKVQKATTVEQKARTAERKAPTKEQKTHTEEQEAPTVEQKAAAVDQMTSDETGSKTDSSVTVCETVARHCCVLVGHVAEVTCVSWSSTDSHLLVSGSRDNTVRLWSLLTGCQLCLFHVLGTIDDVHFDETSRYVIAHCSYAPQRKRAVVLEITNV